MSKTVKWIIVIVIILVVLFLVYWFFIRKDKAPAFIPPDGTGTTPASVFPLRNGSSGEEVRQLQTSLVQNACRDNLGLQINIDGQFGPRTQAALFNCFGLQDISKVQFDLLLAGNLPKVNNPFGDIN